ncbi:hypothetical protein C5S29_04675 [ANME-1 cluster archaeon GoMg3.2]|nr:hypothetical protein [ANME-1 cluster archaeon GoMg3.2]
MDKIRPILVAGIIFLLIFPCLAYESYGIENSSRTREQQQPKTLDEAVNEIETMINDGSTRWEIAKRVATIADNQIQNHNEFYEAADWKWFLSVPASILGPLPTDSSLWTEQERAFLKWRDEGGATAQYATAAEWAWNNRCGQCGENAALVYYLLKEAGEEDIRIFRSARKDHQYVVWGLGCEKDPDNPESWTEDVIIPDSWQHKVLRGQAVLNNEYCAVGEGEYKVNDQTYNRDKKACGFVGNKCCKKIGPCRGEPDRVCRDDNVCYICGREEGQYCCKDERCDEGLKCKEGKCVEKCEEEEVFPDCPPCVGCGSGLKLDAECSSGIDGKNFSVRCTYLGSSHDVLEDKPFFGDDLCRHEEIEDMSKMQDSLENEFVDKGRIYITTRDAKRSFSENYSRLSEICRRDTKRYVKKGRAGEELSVVHELEMLYSIEDLENPEPVPSVYHVIVDGVFLYSERYYIEVNVVVFDSPKEAVTATFDELVGCAKAVIR